MEMCNFLEAAGIAKHKGDVLLEVDMLEKADLFKDATGRPYHCGFSVVFKW